MSRLTRSPGANFSSRKMEFVNSIRSRFEQFDKINVFRLGATLITSLAVNCVIGFSDRSRISRLGKMDLSSSVIIPF